MMKISWKERKNYLCKLIKQVSDENGGDEEEWLREYAREMVNKYRDDLETPIACFDDLIYKKMTIII